MFLISAKTANKFLNIFIECKNLKKIQYTEILFLNRLYLGKIWVKEGCKTYDKGPHSKKDM